MEDKACPTPYIPARIFLFPLVKKMGEKTGMETGQHWQKRLSFLLQPQSQCSLGMFLSPFPCATNPAKHYCPHYSTPRISHIKTSLPPKL